MRYCIYNTKNGQIERIFSGAADMANGQLIAGQSLLEMPVGDDSTHYVEGGAVLAMPQKPNEYCVFDYDAKQWVDPRTLDDIKAQQWSKIKQARIAAEASGFTWDGSTFDSDPISQQRITGAVTLAQMDPNFSIGWTLKDNSVRTLSAAEMIAVGAALGTHVAMIFAKGQALRAQIEAATTQAEVEAIVW